ncbi:DMT family transporter [Solimonas variicoloris]|uniref:DMT family transporter n=1 Tax=Solimonas variicoloris TaxID=254408 RepID=UPI0003639B21|nr:DMT family transporter [Solimonas variicoloris]
MSSLSSSAWRNGLIGVLIFSGSLPATRVAVAALDPWFVTWARAAIAGLLAGGLLLALRQPWPRRDELASLALVMLGVVVGFPLFSALALQQVSSAHALVFVGLLPLATAGCAVLRGGERPRPAFWLFALLGSALVLGYALRRETAAPAGFGVGDAWMLAAIAVCGLGYAEGARLSRRLGGWQTICWALLLALPLMLPLAWRTRPATPPPAVAAWLALAYVSLFSMLLGFVFWYRGLAQGGIAAVGQLQLLQPLFGLLLAGLLLGETVEPAMIGVAVAVALCVAAARHHGARPAPAVAAAVET